MDLTIVAVYAICDGFFIAHGHQEHPLATMSDAEVMTTALIAARYFGGNQQTACAVTPEIVGKAYALLKNVLQKGTWNAK